MPGLFPDTDRYGLPQTTLNGYYYEVDALSYRESWVPGANKTVITARVDALDSFSWITDMVGRSYVEGTTLRRDLPEVNPFDSKQFCTRVEQVDQGGLKDGANDAEGDMVDAASGWPFTKWQRYRCTFEGMPFAMRTDTEADAWETTPELSRYIMRRNRGMAKEFVIPLGGFKVVDDSVPANRLLIPQSGFKLRVMSEITYTLVRWPVTNLPAARKTIRGKINNATFDASSGSGEGYDIPAEELLYWGFDDSNRYYDANEDWVCDLIYFFRQVEGGWNKYFDKYGALQSVSSDGTSSGTKPYTTAAFNTLFVAGP